MNHLRLDEAHSLLYGSDGDGGKVCFSLPTLGVVATIDLGAGSQPFGMDLSPDGATLAVAFSGPDSLSIALLIQPAAP
jgi:streptogramin lyase